MITPVNLLFFCLLFFTVGSLRTNGLHPAPSLRKSLAEPTSIEQVNEKNFLMVRLIEDTSILEVTLLNNTKKSIVFVENFNLNDIKIELKDNFGRLVKERQKKQTEYSDDIIFKPNEGSRQIVTVPRGENKIIAKIDIKSRFELSPGIYNVVVKKRVRFEGEKEYRIVKSAPIKIKL